VHLKSFTLGIGVGIISVSIVFFAAITVFFNSQPVLYYSVDDIINMAEDLGMQFPVNDLQPRPILIDSDYNVDNIEPDEEIEELMHNEYESYNEIGEHISQEEQYVAREDVNVLISYGMPAIFISRLLFEAGVINDENAFTSYIVAAGFSRRLRSGNITFRTNSSFEEVTNILIGRTMQPHERSF